MFRRKTSCRLGAAGAVIVFCYLAVAYGFQYERAVPAREELIGEKDPTSSPADREDVASRDGRQVAWRARRGNRQFVMVNGQQQGTEFDEVRRLRFSPDGRSLAFAGKRDGTWVMVVDGKERAPAYDEMGPVLFSEDGERLAFAARRDKRWIMVVDGKEQGPRLDDIKVAIVSPDGRRLACAARRRSDWLVVIDGKEGPPFHIVGGLAFNRRTNEFVYSGVRLSGSPWKPKAEGRVVMEGHESPVFEGNRRVFPRPIEKDVRGYFEELAPNAVGVSVPMVSPDGHHVAYVARRGPRDFVVMLDGQPGPPFEDILAGPVFSRNGEHMAYIATEKDAVRFVLDGVPTAEPLVSGAWSAFAISPEGRHVAYVETETRWSDTVFTLLTFSDFHRERVFLDRRLITEHRLLGGQGNLMVSGLTFSPDGRHLAYEVYTNDGHRFVVVDGHEGKHYEQVMDGSLSFAGDNAVTYVARTGRKFFRITQPAPGNGAAEARGTVQSGP